MLRNREMVILMARAMMLAFSHSAFADERKTLIIALGNEPDELNPYTMFSHSPSDLPKIFDGLVKFDENLDVAPSLAESWDVSPDGKEYVFYLHQGVKWHDGQELTADDVDLLRSITMRRIPNIPYYEYKDIESVEVIDDYTIKFTLSEGIVPIGERFTTAIIPKHLLEGQDLDNNDFWQHPIGSGPYKFKEWVRGDNLVMVANEDYFGGTPIISEVKFVFVPDESARVSLLKEGEVDAIKITREPRETCDGQESNLLCAICKLYGLPATTTGRSPSKKFGRQ